MNIRIIYKIYILLLRAARALILLRCVPWCVAYWPACSCSHVSQQGSMDCAPPPPPPHLTVDTDKCMKMYETQTSEPEKQTGEMESGEVKNSTTAKVIVKPDNLRSTAASRRRPSPVVENYRQCEVPAHRTGGEKIPHGTRHICTIRARLFLSRQHCQ